MLCGRLAYHLGEHIVRGFQFNFEDCDENYDGRVSLQDWVGYAKDTLEEKFTRSRMRRAAMRFLGERKAENRTRKYLHNGNSTEGPTGISMFNGYDPAASLRLIRACVKNKDAALQESV